MQLTHEEVRCSKHWDVHRGGIIVLKVLNWLYSDHGVLVLPVVYFCHELGSGAEVLILLEGAVAEIEIATRADLVMAAALPIRRAVHCLSRCVEGRSRASHALLAAKIILIWHELLLSIGLGIVFLDQGGHILKSIQRIYWFIPLILVPLFLLALFRRLHFIHPLIYQATLILLWWLLLQLRLLLVLF